MKTAKEWFDLIKDPDLRNKAIKNKLQQNTDRRNIKYDSLHMAITCSFSFSSTPEGSIYWSGVYENAIKGRIALRNTNKKSNKKYIKFKI